MTPLNTALQQVGHANNAPALRLQTQLGTEVTGEVFAANNALINAIEALETAAPVPAPAQVKPAA
jgi:hypothetical protein